MTENELIKEAIKFHKAFEALRDEAKSRLSLDFEDLSDFIYEKMSDSVVWNEDNSGEDLEYQNGNTYSVEVNWIEYEDEEFLLVNGDNGCGDRHIKCLFAKCNEFKFDSEEF